MVKIITTLAMLFNLGFAELNNVKYNKTLHSKREDPAVGYVRKMVLSKEVRDLIGMQIDPITKVTNIYQDYNDRKNIIYEYTINTKESLNFKESLYDEYAIFFWEQNLPNICAVKELKEAMSLGVGFKYIYLDSNKKTIANMTIRKSDCENLK